MPCCCTNSIAKLATAKENCHMDRSKQLITLSNKQERQVSISEELIPLPCTQ